MKKATPKRRLAFRIVETLRNEWPNITMEGWDDEEALEIVDTLLPSSYEELEAWDQYLEAAIDPDVPESDVPAAPSLFSELRAAVHATEDMSVGTVLRAAIAKLDENNQLRRLIDSGYTTETAWNPDGYWAVNHDRTFCDGPHKTKTDAVLAWLKHLPSGAL